MWHASVAVLDEGMNPRILSSVRRLDLAKRVARGLLHGVGGAVPDRLDVGDVVVHLRRPLSEREIASLDPGWLAIPAVDLAGEGGRARPGAVGHARPFRAVSR